jgi:hypothetical protein
MVSRSSRDSDGPWADRPEFASQQEQNYFLMYGVLTGSGTHPALPIQWVPEAANPALIQWVPRAAHPVPYTMGTRGGTPSLLYNGYQGRHTQPPIECVPGAANPALIQWVPGAAHPFPYTMCTRGGTPSPYTMGTRDGTPRPFTMDTRGGTLSLLSNGYWSSLPGNKTTGA